MYRWPVGAGVAVILAVAGWLHAGALAVMGPGRPADAVRAIEWERRLSDEQIRRGDPSEFSAVWSRYLRPGESFLLALRGDRFLTRPDRGADRAVRIWYDRGVVRAAPFPGVEPVRLGEQFVTEERVVPWGGRFSFGRFTAILTEQSGTARVIVYDPLEPARRRFRELRYFPVNSAYRFVVELERIPHPRLLRMGASRGLEKEFLEYGIVRFTVDGKLQRLYVYVPANRSANPTEYFIPFRDSTSGNESYVVTRYVNLRPDKGGSRFILDFNRATNPSCAYSDHFNCPISPRANTLHVPIRAGEMDY